MTQAPATTIATAVRQHGGGRHPLNLPCTAPAGRLQDSRGGVINRRAEGATSSNTLPASCAAAAHPTTGVRRARELSPSLRSQNRPHAQLVEGYMTSLEALTNQPRKELHKLFPITLELCKGFHNSALQILCWILSCTQREKSNQNGQIKTELRSDDVAMGVLIIIKVQHGALHDSLEEFDIRSLDINPLLIYFALVPLGAKRLRSYIRSHFALRSRQQIFGGADCLSHKHMQPHCMCVVSCLCILSATLQLFLMTVERDYYRNHDGKDRANCLNPSRSITALPRQTDQHINQHDQDRRKAQSFAHICKRETNMEFLVEHASLPARVVPQSLQAPRHHVQRGAA